MAFKKGTRILRARDPKTGRYVSAKDLRKSVKREIVEFTGRTFKTVYKQEKPEPISKTQYQLQFFPRVSRQFKPEVERTFTLNFDRKIHRFVETAIENSGFFDNLLSALRRTKSPMIEFTVSTKNAAVAGMRVKLPEMKSNFTFYLKRQDLRDLLDAPVEKRGEIVDRIYNNLKKSFMKNFKEMYQKLGYQFSARQHRGKTPGGRRAPGGGRRKGITGFDSKINVKLWNI